MKFKDIEVRKKYVRVTHVNTSRRGGCQNYSRVCNIYVLDKDDDKKQVLASINGLPAKWVSVKQVAKWEQKTEESSEQKSNLNK